MASSEEVKAAMEETLDRLLPTCAITPEQRRKLAKGLTVHLLQVQDSLGVARIIDGPLPHNIISIDYQEGVQDMLKARYNVTAPLIEPEKAGVGFQYHPGKEN